MRMTNITIYDSEAEKIEAIAESNEMTAAEIVEYLVEYMDDMIADFDLVKPKGI